MTIETTQADRATRLLNRIGLSGTYDDGSGAVAIQIARIESIDIKHRIPVGMIQIAVRSVDITTPVRGQAVTVGADLYAIDSKLSDDGFLTTLQVR